jgi:hypothetical protein
LGAWNDDIGREVREWVNGKGRSSEKARNRRYGQAGQIYESKWGAGFRNIICAHQRTIHEKACSHQVRIEAIEEPSFYGELGIIFSGDQRRTPK